MNKNIIKGIAGIAIFGSLAVALTGCGNKEDKVKQYAKDVEKQAEAIVNKIEEEQQVENKEENAQKDENTKNNVTSESYFDKNKNIKYSTNAKDNINGKVAIIKMGEDKFKTTKHDGYYTYVDNFSNSYDIKEIKNITSEFIKEGNDNWANLFKAEIEYVDKNGKTKKFDTAVIIPKNVEDAYIYGPFDNYTGTTSFVRSFTDLYNNDPVNSYNISGDFYGGTGTLNVKNVNDEYMEFNMNFDGASGTMSSMGVSNISGTAYKIPSSDPDANLTFENDGTNQTGAYSIIKGDRNAKPSSHYKYTKNINGKEYKMIIYFTSNQNLTYLEYYDNQCQTMMNMMK